MASQSEQDQNQQERRARLLASLLAARGEQLGRQARRHSARQQDSEDALEDACVQFMRHYAGANTTDDAYRWMLLVCRRCAWEISRGRRTREKIVPMLPLDELSDSMPGVDDTSELAERSEEVDRVMAAIDCLAPDERTVLLLFGLGFSYEEIAVRCGWSYGKVHRRLATGRARVRRILEGGDGS